MTAPKHIYRVDVDGFTHKTTVVVYKLVEVEKSFGGVAYSETTTENVATLVIDGDVELPERSRMIREFAAKHGASKEGGGAS
jgi:hypothetical protein